MVDTVSQQGELDRLFGLTERTPFADDRDISSVVTQRDRVSLAPGGPGQDIILPQYMHALLRGGVINGDFAEGPEDDDVDIGVIDNKLPGWQRTTVQGTSITAVRTTGNGPAGYQIEFSATDPSTNDEIYLETTTFATSRYRIMTPTFLTQATTPMTNCVLTMSAEFRNYDDDGGQGAETQTTNTTKHYKFFMTPSSDSYGFLKIRIGLKCNTGFTGTETARFYLVYAEPPQLYDVTITGVRTNTFSTGAENIIHYPTNATGGGAESQYIADQPGFVVGISARNSDAVTAGQCEFLVEKNASTNITAPSATLDTTDDRSAYQSRLLNTVVENGSGDFAAGDRLRIIGVADGSFAPTTQDVVCTARLLQYQTLTYDISG